MPAWLPSISRIRFSLRTLLLGVAAVCMTLGFWVTQVRPYRQQQRAAEIFDQIKGKWSSRPAAPPAWSRWLLSNEPTVWVEKVDLSGARMIDDKSQQEIVKKLNLSLSRARESSPPRETILEAIGQLHELESLSLSYCEITDEEIARLGQKPKLKELFLTGCDVTDASIDRLAVYPSLRQLYLRWTRLSPEGVDRLRKALPDCEVYYRSRPAPSPAVAQPNS
jgi:hypothetical protein